MKIGIIGYGSMGKMLLRKFSESGIAKQDLLVSNRTREKLREAEAIAEAADNRELAAKADMIFLCIRPSDFKAVLEEIREAVRPGALIVSLNGSIPFRSIHRVTGNQTAKVIPSVTAEIGKSQTLVCFDADTSPQNQAALKKLLACLGEVIELPEHEMGMGSELVSCMPGFFAAVCDVICQSAQAHTAIPEAQIIWMVLSSVCAAGELMLQKDMSFADVVESVATKGGITQEGTSVIYERFPQISDLLFEKTLEKRRLIAENAEASFSA